MSKTLTWLALFLLGAQLTTLAGWLAVVVPSLREYITAGLAVLTLLWVLAWVLDDALIRSMKVLPSVYYACLLAALAAYLCGWGMVAWLIL